MYSSWITVAPETVYMGGCHDWEQWISESLYYLASVQLLTLPIPL